MSEETEQLHATIAAQEKELAVLRQAYVVITAKHRAALTALRLRVVNATGATKRAANAAAKAATEAENAAVEASKILAKATKEAEAQASAKVAIVKAAVAKAKAEAAEAAEAEAMASEAAEAAVTALDTDLDQIRNLESLLSICMTCKKIRTASNTWDQLEKYLSEHSGAAFSHGVCPECMARTTTEPSATPVCGKAKHILYVDDEECLVHLVKIFLTQAGFRVSGYTDPREALAAARADPHQFDLVVTDYKMPHLSGLDVAQALKDIRADLPVVLASGYITEEVRAKAPAAGICGLIEKPRTIEGLCEAVVIFANAKIKTAS